MLGLSSRISPLLGSLIIRLGDGDNMGYYTKEYDKTCLECGARLLSEVEIIYHTCNQDKEYKDGDNSRV